MSSTAGSADLPMYSMREFYRGKSVFCTGCTGLVGKVLLEKFLRCIPDVKRIYILVRPKKDVKNIQDRVTREILDSKIMDRLKKDMGVEQFYKFAQSKFYAVAGDVENAEILQCPPEELEMLKREVSIIIHSAATIGFHEPLNHAIKLNTYGVLNTLAFAKKCKNIESFVHVSTCYVNSNQPSGSFIEEKQYPLNFPKGEDVEEFCKRVVAIKDQAEVQKLSKKILKYFGFPNTYTFTKNMGEQILMRSRGNIPVAVLRPSIIGSAAREPWPGWVDAATAAGSIYLAGGIGILYVIPGDRSNITDHIPVDYVVNGILLASLNIAYESKKAGKGLTKTFACGSSYRHPVSWGNAFDSVNRYWQSHKPKRGLFVPDLHMVYSPVEYHVRKLAEYTLIRQFYQAYASIVKKKDVMNQAMLLQKRETKAELLDITYRHFLCNEWIFDSTQMEDCAKNLPDNEKNVFFYDLKGIDWFTYFQFYCWGMHKYVLKEDPQMPLNVDVTRTNAVDWFADITFSYAGTSAFNNKKSRDELKRIVLQSAAVQIEIQKEATKRAAPFGQVQERALEIMDQMFADPTPTTVRFLAWVFRKIWRVMYQSIVVDDGEIDKVRSLAKEKSNGPLIIIPTHRSYIDFLILTYIFFAYDLPVPHIAAGEDFLNMFLVRNMFRHSGAFFIRRQFGEDSLYYSIFSAYVKQLLLDNCPIEFFVEGTRSRAGKTLQPKLGLLSIISDAFFDKNVQNLTILPVHISYEKILEGEGYTHELLGEKKKPETLQNLIKARTVLRKKHGDIDVRFAKPINIAEYSKRFIQMKQAQQPNKPFDPFTNADDKKQFVQHLGYKIAHDLDKTTICMPTALIATILLAHREGLAFDQLVDKYCWLKDLIASRGGKVHQTNKMGVTENAVVAHSLALLSQCVLYHKDMVEPNVEKHMERNYLHLSLYRNQIVHVFAMDAIVSCAIKAFGVDATMKLGVDRLLVQREAAQIWSWLRSDFFTQNDPDQQGAGVVKQPQDFAVVIDRMIKEGLLVKHPSSPNKLLIPEDNDHVHEFLGSIVWPFVECYWLSCTALFSMHLASIDKKSRTTVKENMLQQRIQWLGEKLYHQDKMHFYESISLETIKNAIYTLVDMKILVRTKKEIQNQKTKQTTFETYVEMSEPFRDTNNVLKLVDGISKYRKVNTTGTPASSASDMPIISKL